jgi:hypothetical protein
MDQEVLVEQLQKLAKTLDKKAGPVALFMLLAPDVRTEDAWNLIVSAQGLDPKSRGSAIKQLTTWLREQVDKAYWRRIARVTVLRTDDPFVTAVNRAFQAKRQVVSLLSVNLVGVEIPKAIFLQSNKVAA